MKLRVLATGLLFACVANPILAQEPKGSFTIDDDASIFSVVTHKAGVAARLAHNHLIKAEGYKAELSFDATAPEKTTFNLEAEVELLTIDNFEAQQRWYPRLAELEILNEPFVDIADKDRAKIRESMLGKKQLKADKHRGLSARVVSIAKSHDTEFPFTVQLALEVVGRTVTKPVNARFEMKDGRLVIEAHGEFLFTDFEIKPYSALLGSIRNDDPFHVFLHLEAVQ